MTKVPVTTRALAGRLPTVATITRRRDRRRRAGFTDDLATTGRTSPEAERRRRLDLTGQLLGALREVTTQEFASQDARFDRDSRLGRELLFLLADDEWIRGTTELVELGPAKTVDTVITMDVDLGLLAHEAFEDAGASLALPLLVLSTVSASGATGLTHDMEVRDAAGVVLPTLPQSEVARRVSAGLSEIMINLFNARTPPDQRLPARDARLLLSAALYRVLRAGPDDDEGLGLRASPPSPGTAQRVGESRDRLLTLIGTYQDGMQPGTKDTVAADEKQLIANRAARILDAFRAAFCVVVSAERDTKATVMSVRLPARRLQHSDHVAILRPWARLELEILLPSAGADRQVRLQLPPGVSCAEDRTGRPRATACITLDRPRSIEQLIVVMRQILAPPLASAPPSACLAQIALNRLEAVRDVVRIHDLPGGVPERKAVLQRVDRLAAGLGELRASPDTAAEQVLRVRTAWDDGEWLPKTLLRRTRLEAPNRQEVVVRADAVEDPGQRGTPRATRIRLDIAVIEHNLLSAAMYTGGMGALLLFALLALLLRYPAASPRTPAFNAEVLAGVLTLFSAIQAGRVEHPDRSSLAGTLASAGYAVIVLSVLPTIVLAVALSFLPVQDSALLACVTALLVQVGLFGYLFLTHQQSVRRWKASSPWLLIQSVPVSDHRRLDILHTAWWRGLTADALLLGREAHGFVVLQGEVEADGKRDASRTLLDLLAVPQSTRRDHLPWIGVPSLRPVTNGRRRKEGRENSRAEAPPTASDGAGDVRRPANILALLRSGTCEQSLSFVVFREEPAPDWVRQQGARRVAIDPDRLAFEVTPIAHLNVFVGFATDLRISSDEHPLLKVLRTAAHSMLVAVEVQLPVPPPTAVRTDLRWARVRIAVPEGAVPSLGPFFVTLGKLAPGQGEEPWSLLIKTSPGGSPVWLHGAPSGGTQPARTERLLASDLDVIQPYLDGSGPTRSLLRRRMPPPADRREWQILAMTADGQLGIEARVLDHLAKCRPNLQIVGLTTALLHGVSILFVLGHQPGGERDEPTSRDLEHAFRADQLAVHADSWQTAASLGSPPGPGDRPLLRVQTRSREARGGLATTVRALSAAMASIMGEDAETEPMLDVWYVLVRVVEGRTASSLMTVRVPERSTQALTGDDYRYRQAMEAAQRDVRHALSRVAGRQARSSGELPSDGEDDTRYGRDDTVVHLETIAPPTADAAPPPAPDRRPGTPVDGEPITARGATTTVATESRPHGRHTPRGPTGTPRPG